MRIEKVRNYLFDVINTLTTDRNYQINADFLGDVGDYSLNKIPTNSNVENWIIDTSKKQDTYSFRSRKSYSRDTINNLQNIGFFEDLENKINSNNRNGILPNIDNIESIKCLSCGSLNIADTNEAIFDIQLQITYLDIKEEGGLSL
jgi:hypothetical protein